MIRVARPSIGEEEVAAVNEVLASGQLAQGPKVAEFERQFAHLVRRRYAIAVSSGTAALHLALLSLGVGSGDEVVIPPITFFASASMVAAVRGTIRFADVEKDTFTLDPEETANRIGPKTRALMPVDLYGQVATMAPLLELAEDRDFRIIEDACQAHGATYAGKPAGSFGDVSCFSFYATKNMTTGEGGMIVTDDEEIADRCGLLRNHGQRAKYDHVHLGYNLRMSELAAAIGLVQLRKLEGFVARRRRNAQLLSRELGGARGLGLPIEGSDRTHSFYQYIVRVTDESPVRRDELVAHLRSRAVEARPSYPLPLYDQPALRNDGVRDRCDRAEALLPQLCELPVHPALSKSDIVTIANSVRETVNRQGGGQDGR